MVDDFQLLTTFAKRCIQAETWQWSDYASTLRKENVLSSSKMPYFS